MSKQPKPDDSDHDGYEIEPLPEVKPPPPPKIPIPSDSPTPPGARYPIDKIHPLGPGKRVKPDENDFDLSDKPYSTFGGYQGSSEPGDRTFGQQVFLGVSLWFLGLVSLFAFCAIYEGVARGHDRNLGDAATLFALLILGVYVWAVAYTYYKYEWTGLFPGILLGVLLTCLIPLAVCGLAVVGTGVR